MYKRYAAVVERALAAFDSIVEWPDYIAFLGKLLKVLCRSRMLIPGIAGISDVSCDPVQVGCCGPACTMSQSFFAVRRPSEDA